MPYMSEGYDAHNKSPHPPRSEGREVGMSKAITTCSTGQFPELRVDIHRSTVVTDQGVLKSPSSVTLTIWIGDYEYHPTATECRAYAKALEYAANTLDNPPA